MECLRQTIGSDSLVGILDIPRSLRNTVVDVIVLPTQSNVTKKPRGSAFGCLKKYANPVLIDQEKGAWERAVAERYANS